MKKTYITLKKIIWINVLIVFGIHCNAQTRVVKRISKGATEDEYIEIEAENFLSQERTSNRTWYITSDKKSKKIKPDPDKKHLEGVSNGAYIEVLPETFTEKNPKQVPDVNFAKEPGRVAVVKYRVDFKSSGMFYVWVRGYCSGFNDNSVHVGVDGKWPNSGKAIYFCKGQNSWSWSSNIRSGSDNCNPNGERAAIYIDSPGVHLVQFSMREDGFEFDKWVMTNRADLTPR